MTARRARPAQAPAGWSGFLHHLALHQLDPGVLEGHCLPGTGSRVFGGHVGAHCVLAAARGAAAGRVPRSLHLHFLRAGTSAAPVRYALTPLRRGRTLEHWRVDASQEDGVIASAVVVLDVEEPSAQGHALRPGAPAAPELSRDVGGEALYGSHPVLREGLEIREGAVEPGGASVAPARDVWLRCLEQLPADAALAAAVFVWCSDLELTWTADLPYRAAMSSRQAASMDHVVHLHTRLELGGWWLYHLVSPVYRDSRALVTGQLYPDGDDLAATVQQQVLLRMTL